jgi:divalent metal cation (Fe/Co/Zn/Cd) transporter
MIADVVRDVLIEEFDDVQDVLVHVDPESEENEHLTNRHTFLTYQFALI